MDLLLIMALFLGLMFFMSNRAKKQQKAQRESLYEQIQPGADVMTIGGFYGKVVDVDGDVVTLESPSGVETIWSKTAVKEIKPPEFAPAHEDDLAGADLAEPGVVVPDDPSALTPPPGEDGPGSPEVPPTSAEDRPTSADERPGSRPTTAEERPGSIEDETGRTDNGGREGR